VARRANKARGAPADRSVAPVSRLRSAESVLARMRSGGFESRLTRHRHGQRLRSVRQAPEDSAAATKAMWSAAMVQMGRDPKTNITDKRDGMSEDDIEEVPF